MKKILKLDHLKVSSYITSDIHTSGIRGGDDLTNDTNCTDPYQITQYQHCVTYQEACPTARHICPPGTEDTACLIPH